MKIEKLNDHQIRCTLTKEELSDREIKLSELAYGSEKAKTLFRDMMQQAAFEFGFEINEAPIMIEAIPSADKIVLIVTRVEDPDELDGRFSQLSPWTLDKESPMDGMDIPDSTEGADDILNLIRDLVKTKLKSKTEADTEKKPEEDSSDVIDAAASMPNTEGSDAAQEEAKEALPEQIHLTRLYAFQNMDSVILLAKVLHKIYRGSNAVYKDPETGEYFLVASMGDHTPEEFNRICNICTEYSSPIPSRAATESYFMEHMTSVIPENAIAMLSQI